MFSIADDSKVRESLCASSFLPNVFPFDRVTRLSTSGLFLPFRPLPASTPSTFCLRLLLPLHIRFLEVEGMLRGIDYPRESFLSNRIRFSFLLSSSTNVNVKFFLIVYGNVEM